MLDEDWKPAASEGSERGPSCPSAKVTAVVSKSWSEGIFNGSAVGDSFRQAADKSGVKFYASLPDIPREAAKTEDGVSPKIGKHCKLAVIACRTVDCPQQFREAIEVAQVTHIFLEKPGAPTLPELEEMQALAKARGVSVYIGFNKNVAKYVHDALGFCKQDDEHLITFVHNNSVPPEKLGECFKQNSEGMLKNMAIHEIALLVTYYGVSVDTIAEVQLDREFSECLTLDGYTDFSRIAFTIITTGGRRAAIKADRCGGQLALATVKNIASGEEVFRSICPDDELNAKVDSALAAFPETTPYLLANDIDYATMKERICAHAISGAAGDPKDLATLAVAIEAMRLAEYLTEKIQSELGAVEAKDRNSEPQDVKDAGPTEQKKKEEAPMSLASLIGLGRAEPVEESKPEGWKSVWSRSGGGNAVPAAGLTQEDLQTLYAEHEAQERREDEIKELKRTVQAEFHAAGVFDEEMIEQVYQDRLKDFKMMKALRPQDLKRNRSKSKSRSSSSSSSSSSREGDEQPVSKE